jgi:DNA-binding SARP family transcriptional activator
MHSRLTRRKYLHMISCSPQKNLTQKSHSPLRRKVFILELLGTLSLHGDSHPVPLAAQQRRPLGLLAILGLGGKQGMSRDRIEAYLWPESPAARARHALDQLVYANRQALGSDSILSAGPQLRLNPEFVRTDVWEFEEAIRAGQWAAAVGHYKGPLLNGFHLAGSCELESWLDAERARLLQRYQTAIERLANLSAEAGDYSQGITWCRRLADSDPLAPGPTKKLMLALAAAGDRAGAVKHARLYQELVRQQLEMEPDSEIEGLASTFSHPGIAETSGTTGLRIPPTVVRSPRDEGLREAGFRDLAPRNPGRRMRSGIVAVLCFSALIVLLIGAVIMKNGQGRNHRPILAENAARRSKIPLPAARASYVHALSAWSDGSKEGLDTAVVYFRQATALDQEYAEAYAGLADAYVMLAYFGYRPSDAMFPKAKDAALRSMQLDSTLASPRPALAYELTWERDFAGADAEFRKAMAFDPTHAKSPTTAFDATYATAHQWYNILLMILSQRREPAVAPPQAANEDPFSLHVPVVEVTFTKWIDTYPALEGFTSYGPGTITGEVLSHIDDGVFTHLVARYEITDPSGAQSFKTVLQGKASNATGRYDLNGIITWGWMVGAQVHANFQRITPCEFGKRNICYQGTIRIQPR